MAGLALHRLVSPTNMASADFCKPIPAPLDAGSTRQVGRSPRVRRTTFTLIPAASTAVFSVQVSGFEDICLLTQYNRLICDSCSSGQCFACGFLQIPPRGGHPCRPANTSPCRACRGLTPPSGCALPGAPLKKAAPSRGAAFKPRPSAITVSLH